MKLNWYYRIMLSYTPIFFVAVSSVIIVFFTTLSHASENRYMETNKAIVEQMMRNAEANLMLIERNAVGALITDPLINDYYSERPKVIYDYFVIQKKLIDLKSSFPFASSIYLYDSSSERILSDSNWYTLDSFADRTFLLKATAEPAQTGWTEPRGYALATLERNQQKVVSLVKNYHYPNQRTGTIVINIYVSSLMDYLNHYSGQKLTNVHIFDSEGTSSEGFRAVSDYTGWSYSAESVDAASFSAISLFSNVWVIVVLIFIVLALVWFTVITHIHYKPIQNLVKKVNSFASLAARKNNGSVIKSRLNEFNMIDSAIDQLLQKTMDYNSLQEAEAAHRKRILLQELIVGQRVMSDNEWRSEAASLELPIEYDRVCAVSIEIDRYSSFAEKYKTGDQHLLKYILENALRESAGERNSALYCVWTESHQAAVVLFLKESHFPYADTIYKMCNDYRGWVQANLEFTVSIGIGTISESMGYIASSYRNALCNVSLKAVFGVNHVIDYRLAETKSEHHSYALLAAMPEIIHLFLKGEGQWRDKLALLVGELEKMKMGRTELGAFVGSLAQHMEKEIMAKAPGLLQIWRESFRVRFEQAANQSETLPDMHGELESLLDNLSSHVALHRESKSNQSIAMQMKAYIDEHYSDPCLSLVGVSDTFDLPSTHASVLFKKETGEKFIDYVLKVRLKHARMLLIDSEEPIHSISEKVGYAHVLSFHRAFKKVYGYPPGEYRVIYRTQR